MKLISITEIEDQYDRVNGRSWFSPDTMRFFKSRLSDTGYLSKDGTAAYFVTSEKGPDSVRAYSVRRMEWSTGEISTVGAGFQGYATSKQAHNAAKGLALTDRVVKRAKEELE